MELKLDIPESVGRMIRATNILLGDGGNIESEISRIVEAGIRDRLIELTGATINDSLKVQPMDRKIPTGKELENIVIEKEEEVQPSHMPFDDPSGIGDGLGDIDDTKEQEEKPGFVPPTAAEPEQEEEDTFSSMVQSGVTDEDIENDMAVEDPLHEAVVDSSSTPLDDSDSDSLFSHIAGLPTPDPYAQDSRVARTKARMEANAKTRKARVYAANSYGE
jgi:hypothetical protein